MCLKGQQMKSILARLLQGNFLNFKNIKNPIECLKNYLLTLG